MFHNTGLLLLCASLTWPTVALAQQSEPDQQGVQRDAPAQEADASEEAMRLYKIGLLEFEGGDYTKAAQTFSRAFDLDQDPILAYNAARSYEKSGSLERSALFYRHVLDLKAGDDLEDRAREALGQLTQRLSEQKARQERLKLRGVLQVRSDRVGEVLVDGDLIGVAPGDFELAPGVHQVEVRRNGVEPYLTQLKLDAGQEKQLLVTFGQQESRHSTGGWTGFGLVGGGLITGAVALEMSDQPGATSELLGVSSGILVGTGVGLLVWSLWSSPEEGAPPIGDARAQNSPGE